MFFIFSKLLDFIVNPLFYVVALGIWGLLTKSVKVRKRTIWALLILLFLLGNNYFSMIVFRAWEAKAVPISEVGQYEVAVILGGFTDVAKEPLDRVHTNGSTDRMLQVVQLYRLGKVKKIMISGGNGNLFKKKGETIEAVACARLLNDFRVDSADVILEANSRNTRENALNTKHILDSLHIPASKVLLSTSAFHMRRAKGCFEKVGFEPFCYPTDFKAYQRINFDYTNLISPDVNSLERWRMLAHEVLGYLVYKMQGYC